MSMQIVGATLKDEKYPCARCGNVSSISNMDMICTAMPAEYQLICHKCLGKEKK